MPLASNSPSVLVLLATYQGERFLAEQLTSLANQTIADIHLLVSDDGSTDDTLKILESTCESWRKGQFHIASGPQKGFAMNFRALIEQCETDADYFAFCDQDDIWDDDKLKQVVDWFEQQDPGVPQVYSSRTRQIDEDGALIGLSPVIAKPSFANALIQNIAGGNTMVMNRAALELMKRTAGCIGPVAHDYWLYLIVTGVGGIFHYSERPSVSYRQHRGSVSGLRKPWSDWAWRLRKRDRKLFARRKDRQLAALSECSDLLNQDAREALVQYRFYRESSSLIDRIRTLQKSGFYGRPQRNQVARYIDCIFRIV